MPVLAARIRSMLGVHWLVLFGVLLLSWFVLYVMAVPAEVRDASRVFGAEFWSALCTVTPDLAGYWRVAAMWILMSTAMMLPTALPAFATYDDLGRSGAETAPLTLVAGFLAVWWGVSLFAAAFQMALFRFDLVSGFGDSRSAWLSAALLAVAGGYQFSTFKESCLSKCRAPLPFFMENWAEGPWRMGVRLGVTCVGCCWALMLLAFVGGVMSLAFMGVATLMMALEKMPDIGGWLSRPLGFALLAGAGWMALSGL